MCKNVGPLFLLSGDNGEVRQSKQSFGAYWAFWDGKIHGNVEVAKKAAYSILQLDPQDSAAYVLSNISANAGMWAKLQSWGRWWALMG